MSASDTLLNYVIPSIGSVLCVILVASPLRALPQIYKSRELSSFNPTPYTLMIFNCVAWCTYAIGLRLPVSAFVFYPNCVGLLCGFILFAVTYPIASLLIQKKMAIILFIMIAGYIPTAFSINLVFAAATRQQLFGFIGIIVQLIFFSSPLETMSIVLKTKNAETIYWPLALTTVIAASFTSIWGIAINDVFITVPNVVTTLLGWVQLVLCLVYRKKRVSFDEESQGNPPKHTELADL